MSASAFAVDVAWVALFAALFGLDRRGAFQSMISQPLVAGPALGLFFGNIETGLWLGSTLQLLFMSSVLFGASVPPNETVASVAIVAMVLLFERHGGGPAGPALWAGGILIGFPLAAVGRRLEIHIDRYNLRYCKLADAAAQAGACRELSRLPLRALVRAGTLNALLVAPFAAAGALLLLLVADRLPGVALTGLTAVSVYILPALGLAVALSTLRRRRALAVASAAFVMVLIAAGHSL